MLIAHVTFFKMKAYFYLEVKFFLMSVFSDKQGQWKSNTVDETNLEAIMVVV